MSYTDTTKLGLKKAVPNSNQPFETTVFNSNLDLIDDAVAAIEANNWVTNARIADAAVGSAELAANAVTNAKIAANAVTTDKIAAGAIQPSNIAIWAVNNQHIAPDSVTPDKIVDGSIGNAEIALNAISSLNLQSNSVSTDKLQNSAVTDQKLAGGLNAGKLAYGTLNPGLIPLYSLSADQLSTVLPLASKDYVTVPTVDVYTYDNRAATTLHSWQVANTVVQGDAATRNTPAKFASGSYTATPSSGLITIDLTPYGFTAIPVVTGNIFGATTAKLILTLDTVTATQVKFKVWTSTFASSTTSTRIDWQAVQD